MTLLAPDPARIGRPDVQPAADRAPDSLAAGTPEPLRGDLVRLLGADRVLARASDLVRYASDASPYRLFPQVVVMAHDENDVLKTIAYARERGMHLTFRGGGTSLNGQGQTDGILVDVRRHWFGVEAEDGGRRARLKPGTLVGTANRILKPHGYLLGPDPASKDIATVGAVIANNSGGMRCGVTWDSYSTVRGMKLVLASGTVIDTEAPDAEERFADAEPELARGLIEIRDELRAHAELAQRVRRKFEIKNTTGYRLCAFLDADTPLEIFRRLVVGSEGTLAFIAEAVMETRPEPPRATVSWLHFGSIDDAMVPVSQLVEAGARAVELMVAPALIAAAHNMQGTPEHWKELPPESAALLVEFGGDNDGDLDAHEMAADRILWEYELLREPEFVRDAHAIELAWGVREGLHGLVGRLRAPETALIIEDVCVRPERLPECAKDLQALLGEHGFLAGVAGHASAGNLHFQLTPDFAKPEDRERYEAFMDKLGELILDKYDGSMKAEHGTGIAMTPWVEREWGDQATEMMWRVKRLADPHNVLNPGAVLSRNADAHLSNLKIQPMIEEVAAHCVECGFCEPVCPSRNVTTTPRQRIVLRREMARQPEGSPVYEALVREYEYDGIETCAADGTCAPSCPLAIDTGAMIKEFRARQRTEREEAAALALAKRWRTVERAARMGLRAGSLAARVVGDDAVARVPRALRKRVSEELLPVWPGNMPPPAPATLPETTREGAAAVYMPACVNRIFGNARGTPPQPTLPEALVEVSRRAGLPLWIPPDAAGNCCSVPWSSKGYTRGKEHMASKARESLNTWTRGGELPLVIDASSCAHGLIQDVGAEVEVLDSIAWAHDRLLPKLEVRRKVKSAAVHPTCSAGHMQLATKLEALAAALADEVIVPVGSTCCGMAGDRGLLHPELPQSALREVKRDLDGRKLDACMSSNRTCEIALQQVTGRPYSSFVFLLEELTR
ncbi:MAG TPA: FAD-binding and (Fe-S)-binding domain-containing protein [Thermoleophilaceae bacterium]|nr:FAD-binding and (Fe-S)-binding domain-containing protein [Thermoleophilaceae bacterium]